MAQLVEYPVIIDHTSSAFIVPNHQNWTQFPLDADCASDALVKSPQGSSEEDGCCCGCDDDDEEDEEFGGGTALEPPPPSKSPNKSTLLDVPPIIGLA